MIFSRIPARIKQALRPKAHCRGEARAALRRSEREQLSRWQAAHAASAPYRERIVAFIEKLRKQQLGAAA